MNHTLEFSNGSFFPDDELPQFAVEGRCTCGAWFTSFVEIDLADSVMRHAGGVSFNGWPLCPAVWLVNRGIEKELTCAADKAA